jgi:hypothetical protein
MVSLVSRAWRAALVAASVVLGVACGADTASAQSVAAEQWWPLQSGNRWVLRDAASGDSKEIRVDARQGALAYVSGMLGQDHWFGFSSAAPNSLYVWNDDRGAWYPFARFGYNTTRWRFDLSAGGCDLFESGWARGSGASGSGTTVNVPAGSFAGARELGLRLIPEPNIRCRTPVSKVFFAKGVGPVKLVLADGTSFDLETAVVGGTSYPRPSVRAIEAMLSTPKRIWINVPNTIRCITTPCPSNEVTAKAPFTFDVKNNTTRPVTFQFASGQQFDVELLDAQGRVGKAWSDDRFFTMALTSRTVQPGATISFSAELELKDRNGTQLSGVFTARARLTTARWSQPVLDVAATNSVEVRIQ